MTHTIQIVSPPAAADVQVVRQGLSQYNVARVPSLLALPRGDLTLVARDETATIIGGAYAEMDWGWLYVDTLWVDAATRGQGVGSHIMHALETYAVQHDLRGIYLLTSSFQALPFYQKLGYTLFGQQADRPLGHSIYYLHKMHLIPHPTPAHITLEIHQPPKAQYIQLLQTGLIDHAAAHVPIVPAHIAVFLRDDAQQIMGGIYGSVYWDWLDTRFMWLHEALRGRGYGKKLLSVMQRECQRLYNGIGMVADTADFQALDFYLAQGFTVVGTLPDRPPGHTSYFIEKRF